MSPSSRGLGHRPFTAVTGVRIPLGMPIRHHVISVALKPSSFQHILSPSSRGLGHRPFTAVTGVRIPLGMPNCPNSKNTLQACFFLSVFRRHLYIHHKRYPVCGEFTIQIQGQQKKTLISDTAKKNFKTLQETTNERLAPSCANQTGIIHNGSTSQGQGASPPLPPGRSKSTISREFKRNSDGKTCSASQARHVTIASAWPAAASARLMTRSFLPWSRTGF